MRTAYLPTFTFGILLSFASYAIRPPQTELSLPDHYLSIADYPGPWDNGLQPLSLDVWIWKPAENGPFPTVVALHGSGGVYHQAPVLDPDNIAGKYKYWGKQFKEAGFQFILVDSFTTRGYGDLGIVHLSRCDLDADITCRANNVKAEIGRPWDAYAGLQFAKSLDTTAKNHIGLIGWSHGGSGVLSSLSSNAHAPIVQGGHFGVLQPIEMQAAGFAAAVAIYPGCGMYGYYTGEYQIYAPVRIFIGAEDETVNPQYCFNRTEEARLANGDIELYAYEAATHGYDYYEWDSFPATDTKNRVISFFQKKLDTIFSNNLSIQ